MLYILKDHNVRELINKLRDDLTKVYGHKVDCLRDVIHRSVREYLDTIPSNEGQLISISAEGLDPELKTFMAECIKKKMQTRTSKE